MVGGREKAEAKLGVTGAMNGKLYDENSLLGLAPDQAASPSRERHDSFLGDARSIFLNHA